MVLLFVIIVYLFFILQCEECQFLYNNKLYFDGDLVNFYNCKLCECYNYFSSCVYNVSFDLFFDDYDFGGGGVCENCQDFIVGQFCEICIFLYFRLIGKSKYDFDVCVLC